MVTEERVILLLCPPCLERDPLTNFLTRSHISTALRQFPSYCSVRKSRCASRGLLLGTISTELYNFHRVQSEATVAAILHTEIPMTVLTISRQISLLSRKRPGTGYKDNLRVSVPSVALTFRHMS